MAAIIHRVVWLDETIAGHPKPSQFIDGDIQSWDILRESGEEKGFYIGYGGVNPYWPGGGYRPRYLAYRHSANLYVVFCARGPSNFRLEWLEESPRDGLRGRPYCEQVTHGWREFRCTGIDTSLPPNDQWIYEKFNIFQSQPPAPSTVSEETPWTIGTYEIYEIIPSISKTIAGFDLPEYTSVYADPTNGDEID